MLIEVFDSAFKSLVDPASELTKLAGGFMFTEGPIWDRSKQCLYFSDIPANTMFAYSKTDGVTVKRKPSDNCNGNTIDHVRDYLQNRVDDRWTARTSNHHKQLSLACQDRGRHR